MGMSTVPEVLVARHSGIRVLGISCITNLAAGMTDNTLSHEEVKETADRVQNEFIRLVTGIVSGCKPTLLICKAKHLFILKGSACSG